MGSQPSTEQVKVFTPATPVQYADEFLKQLDNSEESNYARSQLSEKFIEKQVNKRLENLEKEAKVSLNNKINSELKSNDLDLKINANKLDEKIESLTNQLKEINSHKFFQDRISKENNETLNKARENVRNCLKVNSDKPLNCWEEVENFKGLVKEL